MAIDKIKPLKIESPSGGGTQTDPFPTEANPSQDYISIKGMAIEGLETHTIDRINNDITLTDPNNGTSTVKQLRTALNNIFDNSTNGFISTNVQSAIEEAKNTAEGFPRIQLTLTANGTLANGNWITYSELLANPKLLFPIKVRIKEITWVNVNLTLGAFDFEFYKNGQLLINKVFTYSAPLSDRLVGYGYYSFSSNLDLNAGESLYIKYVKPSGTSLSDLALVVWIERIP